MARGRALSYGLQREAILQQAAALFALHGYASATMQQVAQACGMSKPTLYHYFRDKDALLVELTQSHVEHLLGIVDAVMALELAPRERVEQLILRFVQAYAHAQHAHRVLTEDTRFLAPADRERVLGCERRVVSAFAKAIAAYKPELSAQQIVKPVTMLLFGMINWMFTWLQPDGALDHDAMAPLVVNLFLGGLPAVASAPRGASPKHRARATRSALV